MDVYALGHRACQLATSIYEGYACVHPTSAPLADDGAEAPSKAVSYTRAVDLARLDGPGWPWDGPIWVLLRAYTIARGLRAEQKQAIACDTRRDCSSDFSTARR